MLLDDELQKVRESSRQNLPAETYAKMMSATQALIASDIVAKAPKLGDKLPGFSLPNQTGEKRQLSELLKDGPVVLTFYRGGWCPYCNLELRAYQSILADIKAAGASLVAITPELPDESLSTIEKNELAFEVLSDQDASYARELNLIFTLPEELRPIYLGFGIDIEKHNGQGQLIYH